MRVFRTAAWIWIGYLVSLAVMDRFIYPGGPLEPVLWYHLINGAPALLFVGLSYLKWLKTRPQAAMIPWMILLISIVPILLNHLLDLRLPAAPLANVEGMVLRQLPVMFVGLALIAWRYPLWMVLFYTVFTCAFEWVMISIRIAFDPDRQLLFYFVIAIRTISLAVVGIFVSQLIARLRRQQEALQAANQELAHYASTLETLAVSRERNRLARELHDTLAHTLSGLSVQLETVKAYWAVQPETAYQLLAQSLAITRSGLDETRRALRSLRASPLEDLGLRLALQQMAESAAGRAPLQLHLALSDKSLAPDVEQCLYRVAQEAIENVVRHARAQNLTVQFTVNDQQIVLVIEDDGVGTDQSAAPRSQEEQGGHFGLRGMRERAQLAGGQLTVSSQPGQGTRVQLLIEGYRHDQNRHL